MNATAAPLSLEGAGVARAISSTAPEMWQPAIKRERIGRRDVSRRVPASRTALPRTPGRGARRRIVSSDESTPPSNLTAVDDRRPAAEWPAGFRPQSSDVITHDALYRVVGVEMDYDSAIALPQSDAFVEWRGEMQLVRASDPMRTEPAPRLTATPTNRVMSLGYEYDWLANMTSWDDDASQFYERSIGGITNGFEAGRRPSALYLATNLSTASHAYSANADRGGYVEMEYGAGGNVVAMTTRAQCTDVRTTGPNGTTLLCTDTTGDVAIRGSYLRSHCACRMEQLYQYRWDELNRLNEARRLDRNGSGDWALAARQRYRYDGANQRTVKQTLDPNYTTGDAVTGLTINPAKENIALYVYGGDYERRGLARNTVNNRVVYVAKNQTETQFMVGGARVVQKSPGAFATGVLDPDDRVTVAITNLIGSTSAVIDLVSGALVETSTYYPNGARETYRAPDTENVAAEPMGFTGKEADEEVGVTYFGERYLIPRIGRWASPDPLSIHAAGGGEALNTYHYVSGNLLQARDPLGLEEFETYEEYTAFANSAGIEAVGHDQMGEQGHWLTMDRTGAQAGGVGYGGEGTGGGEVVTANASVWDRANEVNFSREEGYREYATLDQRAGFYSWFQGRADERGHQFAWAGAAATVVENAAVGVSAGRLALSAETERMFREINARIFTGAFGDMRTLDQRFSQLGASVLEHQSTPTPMSSAEGARWDSEFTVREQSVLQRVSQHYSADARAETSAIAKHEGMMNAVFAPVLASLPAFPADANFFQLENRWAFGMTLMGHDVYPADMPSTLQLLQQPE